MKNLFKYIFAVVAAMALTSAVAIAQDGDKNAIKVDKQVEGPAADGSYTLTLETYVTGEKDSRTQTVQPVPSDIVLVLDVSGSMDFPMVALSSTTETKDDLATIYQNFTNKTKYYYVYNSRVTSYVKITSITRSGAGTKYTYKASYLYNEDKNLSDLKLVEGGQSRLDALVEGTSAFIDIMSSYTTDKVQNKISVVKFAANDTDSSVGNTGYTRDGYNKAQTIIKEVVPDETGSANLKTAISGLYSSGGTYTKRGLDLANSILDAVTRESKKSVILFTDGATNSDISQVVSVTNDLKLGTNAKSTAGDKSATVFTIGAFASEEAAGTDVVNFLSFNSSDYKGDVKYNYNKYSGTLSGIKDKEGNTIDFSIIASNTSDLRKAFEKAAESSAPRIDGGADITLEESKVTIKDIVSSHFVIPDGNAAGTLTVVPVKTPSLVKPYTNYVPEWDESKAQVNPEGLSFEIKEGPLDADGKKTKSVDVKGFDFSAHWVGLERTFVDTEETERKIHEEGQMLRITIKISPDPNDFGGEVKTNDARSGFYYAGVDEPLQPYITPGAVFVPMDMSIILSGLDTDESAMFKVYRYAKDNDGKDTDVKEYVMTIVLTGKDDASTISKLPIVSVRKVGSVTHYDPIKYLVEVDSNWSWKYTITASSDENKDDEHALFYRTDGGEFKATPEFVFSADKTDKATGTAKYVYDENMVNNVFNRNVEN